MVHRLLSMNIDGTILQRNGRLHKSVKEAIDYVQNKGVYVTLVTSRNFIFAKRIAKALKLKSLIIAHHGAFIASSVDQAIYVKRIPENILLELIQFLETFSCHIRLVHEKYSVSNKQVEQQSLIGKAVIDTNRFSMYHHHFVKDLSEYLEEESVHPTHLEVEFSSESAALDAFAALKAMYYEIDPYLYKNQLIILPNGVSKLAGLMYVGDYLQITLKQMVAIGSGLDDIDILEAVPIGVAMGNAPNEVKQAADWITRTNTEHGVAYMVKEHFRKQQPIAFLEKINSLKEK
ncbi:HAD-IIB family hydrolase [Bacillus kwashiorkori]|uniref:HAD-IIB family hydrolase n=1 Tax=Bacillus kwashiorkori TaxID=1522318 RepID=UPI000780E77F|nr:HAD-IIB family hydrolase [Bacillus kwashiorkori]